MFRFVFCCFIVVSLAACVTAYRPPKSKIYSCPQFEREIAPKLLSDGVEMAEKLDGSYLDRRNKNDDYRRNNKSEVKSQRAVVLRYSEGGRLVNRCDYSRALQAIKSIDESKTIVVYVHGWRNDSGAGSDVLYNYRSDGTPLETMGDDYDKFNTFLDNLQYRRQHPVLGIFISWKGGSGIPGFETLTYKNRRDGADKIGNAGGLPRLLGAVKNISDAQETASHGEPNQVNNSLILIGHSFGGRILFKSIVDDMIINTQLTYPDIASGQGIMGDIDSIADLILLINPAFEAATYQALAEFRFMDPSFADEQKPLIVTFQSESDRANGWYFPIGQRLSFILNNMEAQTVGFHKRFHTGRLERITDEDCSVYDEKSRGKRNQLITRLYDGFCDYGIALTELPPVIFGEEKREKSQRTPFMVVSVDDKVLDGHGWYKGRGVDSFANNDSFPDWLLEYILLFEDDTITVN